jgi:hypothetical protein
MKLAVVTRSDNNVKELTDLTHPSIKRYAGKCGADFLILTDDEKPPKSHYRILQLYKVLEEYNRVLVFDSDLLIRKDCPNIFDIVPYNKIGTIFEDVGSRLPHRRALIEDVQKERGDIGWREGYNNTGVFVVSDMHREIFNLDLTKVWRKFGEDDVELGYQIRKHGFKIHELPWIFNCMSLHSEEGFGSKLRFDAYILHFAGGGIHRSILPQFDQIEQDLALMKRFNMVM